MVLPGLAGALLPLQPLQLLLELRQAVVEQQDLIQSRFGVGLQLGTCGLCCSGAGVLVLLWRGSGMARLGEESSRDRQEASARSKQLISVWGRKL